VAQVFQKERKKLHLASTVVSTVECFGACRQRGRQTRRQRHLTSSSDQFYSCDKPWRTSIGPPLPGLVEPCVFLSLRAEFLLKTDSGYPEEDPGNCLWVSRQREPQPEAAVPLRKMVTFVTWSNPVPISKKDVNKNVVIEQVPN